MKHNFDITQYYDRILEFCKRWAVTEFGIFGSCANATEHAESDVDVLVSFTPEAEWSLFDLVTMQLELQEIFGREVDLVEKAALKNPFRKKSILDSVEVIYAA